ncbi:MAG: M24 family metallopeptidase [Proteobacteria bacterium]|nr:M24 family metallopeptidase [Pseudomonadota bacterium]MDA0926607.1 M24 family metallopeptidase [Pseudomonadota bacterium]
MRVIQSIFCLMLLLPAQAFTADALKELILPLRERAEIEDRILAERLDTVVPMLMRREGIDAWILIAREYNEDPVLKTMLPATWLNARRRTVLMFIDHGGSRGVERMAVARYAVGDLFPGVWDPEEQPDQWQRIADILNEADPARIALNYSENYALADGLTYTEQQALHAALPARMQGRLQSAESLAVGWLETRIESEMEIYRDVMAVAHAIIREGFSAEVIIPGVTTTDDLVWWFRQRVQDLGLETWFHTSIETERSKRSLDEIAANNLDPEVLYKGDHIHIDFGISYLNLQTDTQQNAYILRDDEDDVPDYMKLALREGNRLQDILTSNFQVGRSGNDILARSLQQAREEGLNPIIYTHPIGLHGHAAGTTIGMWDQQDGVPGTGDYLMQPNTAYSIELNALVDVPEWGEQPLPMKLEEDGFFTGDSFYYIQPRQTEYHVIDPTP